MSRTLAYILLALYLLLFPSQIHAQQALVADAAIRADIKDSEQGSYIEILIDSGSNAINAVDLKLSFDISRNTISRINLKDSFCKIFIASDYSNNSGEADIVCGLPTPGLYGKGVLARIYFDSPISADSFEILEDSQILANDGYGTPVLDKIIKSHSR